MNQENNPFKSVGDGVCGNVSDRLRIGYASRMPCRAKQRRRQRHMTTAPSPRRCIGHEQRRVVPWRRRGVGVGVGKNGTVCILSTVAKFQRMSLRPSYAYIHLTIPPYTEARCPVLASLARSRRSRRRSRPWTSTSPLHPGPDARHHPQDDASSTPADCSARSSSSALSE